MHSGAKSDRNLIVETECTLNELLRRCLSTPIDEDAWNQFVARYFDTIERTVKSSYLFKIRYGHEQALQLSEDEVLDLVQTVFKRLVEKDRKALREFHNDHDNSIYAYLKIISIRVVLDFLRKASAQKRPAFLFSLEELKEKEDGAFKLQKIEYQQAEANAANQTALVTEEMLEQALDSIRKGKHFERDVIIFKLRIIEEMEFKDISRIKSLELSRSGASAAFQRIQKRIKPVLLKMLNKPR